MKFKKGDKVTVRKDLDFEKRYGTEGYDSHPMTTVINFLVGRTLTVSEADEKYRCYWCEETGYDILFTDEMFEEGRIHGNSEN